MQRNSMILHLVLMLLQFELMIVLYVDHTCTVGVYCIEE